MANLVSEKSGVQIPPRALLKIRKMRLIKMPVKNTNEISFCGIPCGKCIKGKAEFKEKTKQILNDIRESGLDRWQHHEPKQEFFNYDELKKGLNWLASLDCKGCHASGGNPQCMIRECAKEKKVNNCGECSEMPCDIVRKVKKETGIDVEKNFRKH